jgi:hypothetical protein
VLDLKTLWDNVDLTGVRLLTDDCAPVGALAFHVALERDAVGAPRGGIL